MTASQSSFNINQLAEPEFWRNAYETTLVWLRAELLTTDAAIQFAAIAVAFALAYSLRPLMGALITHSLSHAAAERVRPVVREHVLPALTVLLLFMFLLGGRAAIEAAGVDITLIRVATNLAGAWLIIRGVTRFIGDPFWSRTLAGLAWAGAALNILGLLGPTAQLLDAIGFQYGDDSRVSVLIILRAAVLVLGLFALAAWLSQTLRKRIEALPAIEPSLRILFANAVQVGLLAGAVIIGLSTVGINLSALAIVGGAVGIGIGFGLQEIFANLVAGVILLLDRSIKPGDVIEVEGSYGHVNSLGLRYISVITRDAHEHLIPNSMLVKDKVVNWSFSDTAVRIKRQIGISYSSDVPKVMELVAEAAKSAPRTLNHPPPRCLLIGFGDNSVDLEVRFWVRDPQNGVNSAASDVLVAIWEAFKEHGVEIPFPQRDVHIRSGEAAALASTVAGAGDQEED